MIELKCKACDTGLFAVENIAQVGKLPLRITCHICGTEYIVKLDKNGSPAVFYRKGREPWRKMEIRGLKEIEPAPGLEELVPETVAPAPGSEVTPELEDVSAPGPEEPTEEPPEEVAAEKPEGVESGNEDTLPEVGADQESAEEVE